MGDGVWSRGRGTELEPVRQLQSVGQSYAFEFRAVKFCALQLCALQLCALQLCALQLCALKLYSLGLCITEFVSIRFGANECGHVCYRNAPGHQFRYHDAGCQKGQY
jgi:hypothetical protein